MPYLVMDILGEYSGIPGLFVAAAYSGTLRSDFIIEFTFMGFFFQLDLQVKQNSIQKQDSDTNKSRFTPTDQK